ncbi:hypothetical protein LPJ61_001278 [Coemansia biformis]|uniref:Uncharacterized protein n=1 Tax=Coemansia biformis TaxID=1286918 RepID=A0A9W8CXF9_9FUNG|nr:hypothetical protein LPJ61_001278 [Coemansia biformis]
MFRRASDIQRKASSGDTRWARRPHADSAASAATAVDPALLTGDDAKSPTALHPAAATLPEAATDAREPNARRKQRRITRRVPLAALPELLPCTDLHATQPPVPCASEHAPAAKPPATCSSPSLGIVGVDDAGHEDGFWRVHDQRLGVGGDGDAGRVILDAMVDDVLSSGSSVGGSSGWRMEPSQGTFNDVLDNSTCSIHPIVLAFARAHIENLAVVLAPEHIWLAIVQGLAAVMRGADKRPRQAVGPRPPAEVPSDTGGVIELQAVWHALRDSSAVPGSSYSESAGRRVQLFAGEMNGRHTVHAGRGAAPLAMAAAAAGSRSTLVDYGRIEVGRRLVSWQPRRRSTNPQWVQALHHGPGIRQMLLAGNLQSWSSLCVLARQIKETTTGRYGRAIDWWTHRMHLLTRDLADYFAAQDERTGEVSPAWRQWLSLALFDGHSGVPAGTRLDGWLAALFPLDAEGDPIHERQRWYADWERVPSGVDLLRVSVPGRELPVNMYSGFVGTQQLYRDAHDGAHHRDGASTLAGSREQLPGKHAGAASLGDLSRAHASLDDDTERALAPLIGWALDG